MSSRYFFDEATNLGCFLLPEDRRQEWLELMRRWDRSGGERREDVLDEIDASFGYCRLEGKPSDWCFTQPVRVVFEEESKPKNQKVRLRSWRKPLRR